LQYYPATSIPILTKLCKRLLIGRLLNCVKFVVNIDRPEERVPILSELHMHIQDAFNEAGVQIMSPAFESQPEKKVIVPKSQWFPKQSKLVVEPNGADQ
jgi:hypothetical protein